MIRALFDELTGMLHDADRGRNQRYVQTRIHEAPCTSVFFDFIKNINYTGHTPSWRIVADYIAGMTDLFAYRTYSQLFLPTPVV